MNIITSISPILLFTFLSLSFIHFFFSVGSGSLITNIVPDHSVSSLLTSHISRTFSSYITRSDVGDYSMTGTSDHSAFQTRSSSTLSPHTVSFSSLATFSSSSNKDFKMSTLNVLKTTSSPVVPSFNQTPTTASSTIFLSQVVSSYYKPTLLSIPVSILSSDVLFYATATSQSSVIVSTPSSHQLSSYTTNPSSTFATLTPSSFLPSSHTASTLTSIVDVFASSSVHVSYRTLSLTATTNFSFSLLSSYNAGTSPSFDITTTISSSRQLSSYTTSPSLTFATLTPSSFLPSAHTASTLISIVDVFAPSSVHTSYRKLSLTAATTFSFPSLSSYNTGTSRSFAISTTIPSSLFISYHTHISPLSFFTISLSSSYHSSTSPSSLVNITALSDVLSRTTSISQPSYLLSRRKRTFVSTITSSYHTVSSPTFLSVHLSSYHTSTSPLSLGAVTPSSGVKSSITPFLNSQTGITTASSPSSYLPITLSPDYFSSRLTSPSRATISHLSDLPASYHTQSFVATITPSSSYHTPTSPLSSDNKIPSLYHSFTLPSSVGIIISSVNLSSSYNAVLSSFSPTIDKSYPSNLPSSPTTLPLTSHTTFSLSFLSSSIVSSMSSISFDLSTGLSKSDTSTKSSLKTSWLVRPSYTWQGPHTATVILTLTSVRIPGNY